MSDYAHSTDEAPSYAHRPELALSAVLYLMSRFPTNRSPAVARSIVEHLAIVSSDERLPECVRETAAGLSQSWRGYAHLSEAVAGSGVVAH
ncbi:MAG TPA: hypothetical protein PLN31_02095 [Azoarcus taiwanensis]|nr:hypothetical protein [Azoarcus taiwanensis]